MLSFGAWALSSGFVKPMSTTVSPSWCSNISAIGMEPPARMNTGSRPNVSSSACADDGVVDGGLARPAPTEVLDRDLDARRRHLVDVRLERLEDPLWVLVGDEPHADLGVGVGRDDRLAAVAHEPAPDAVDVER